LQRLQRLRARHRPGEGVQPAGVIGKARSTSAITSRVIASGSKRARGGTAPGPVGAEGLAVVGVEVPLAALRLITAAFHQHAVAARISR
jgi:hypothetical protein